MLVLQECQLALDIDGVLHGQGGGNPEASRKRNPHVAEAASRTLEEGMPLLSAPLPYSSDLLADFYLRHQRSHQGYRIAQ
jgi:hypothetical protein